MGLNIEIKARCTDHVAIEKVIQKMNIPFEGMQQQSDTFFNVPNGRLKLRESDTKGNFLIPYLRPDVKKPRKSDYVLLDVNDVDQSLNILEKMFGVRGIVEKTRKVFHYDNIRIHLDQVDDLGNFIELEGVIKNKKQKEETLQKIDLLMEIFEIKDEDIVINAYIDMLEKKGTSK